MKVYHFFYQKMSASSIWKSWWFNYGMKAGISWFSDTKRVCCNWKELNCLVKRTKKVIKFTGEHSRNQLCQNFRISGEDEITWFFGDGVVNFDRFL